MSAVANTVTQGRMGSEAFNAIVRLSERQRSFMLFDLLRQFRSKAMETAGFFPVTRAEALFGRKALKAVRDTALRVEVEYNKLK